jgi:multisubunit Na+/H+ antiporter MnhE subunit
MSLLTIAWQTRNGRVALMSLVLGVLVGLSSLLFIDEIVDGRNSAHWPTTAGVIDIS